MVAPSEETARPRKRILVVSNLYPPAVVGGYERECAEVVEFLRETHDVRVLTSRTVKNATGDVIPTLPFVGRPLAGRVLAAPLALAAARATRRSLAEFRPDVVWIWNGARIPHTALRILEEQGVPVLWRVCEHWFGRLYSGDPFLRHLLPVGSPRRLSPIRLLARLWNLHPALRLNLARRRAAAISWNSDALRRMTPVPSSFDVRFERTIYPATSQAESLAKVERSPDEVPLIAFVGRLEPAKGPEIAIAALAALRRRHGTTARLELAGDVPSQSRLELLAEAHRLGVADSVVLAGPLDRSALADLLGRAHVVVIPPVWDEPFGLVAVEAAYARVPVVSARSGGLVEILREPEEALFFDKGDVEGCADALDAVLKDTAGSAARVEAAFGRAQFFSLGRYLQETAAFLDGSLEVLTR